MVRILKLSAPYDDRARLLYEVRFSKMPYVGVVRVSNDGSEVALECCDDGMIKDRGWNALVDVTVNNLLKDHLKTDIHIISHRDSPTFEF